MKSCDRVFLLSFWGIVFIGILTVLSLGVNAVGTLEISAVLRKQLIYIVIGIIVFFVTAKFPVDVFRSWVFILLFYILSITLLITTLAVGATINNAKRWLIIGGVQIQPSEIVKVLLIISYASFLSYKDRFNQYFLGGLAVLSVIPIIILVFIEPNGSMALLIFVITVLMVFISLDKIVLNTLFLSIVAILTISFILIFNHLNILWGIFGIVLIAVVFVLLYYNERFQYKLFLKLWVLFSIVFAVIFANVGTYIWNHVLYTHQKQRIETFLNPSKVDKNALLNIKQSKIAVGSGRIIGKGWGSGTQSRLHFLPEYKTDFIFASYAEQFGFVGSFILLALFATFIGRIILKAFEVSADTFYSLLLLGFAIKFSLEILVSIGTNIGIVPVTGLPLPFLSFGGTNIIMSFFAVGVVCAIIKNIKPFVSVSVREFDVV